MSDLLTEVDEMMRQERMEKIWKDYGSYIIAFVLGVIFLTACVSGYKAWNQSVREAQTSALLALQDDENYPQNVLDAGDLDLRGSLKGVAYLSAAGNFLEQEKTAEAMALYERAAAGSDIPAEFSHLAELMIVRLNMGAEGAEAAELSARAARVYDDAKSPWRFHARLDAALLEAHLNENFAAARAHLAVILSESNLPKSLTDKAEALDHVYSLKEKDVEDNA